MTDSPSPPPILFRPVPTQRVRHDGWTPARQEVFLIYLEKLGMVSTAARAVGMSPKSAYALFNRSEALQQADCETPSFAEAWRNAVQMGQDKAIGLAIRRAIDGEVTPVFYRGRQVGERRAFDNRMVLAALRIRARTSKPAHDPNALWAFLKGEIA